MAATATYFILAGNQANVEQDLNKHAQDGGKPILLTTVADRIVVIVERGVQKPE